MKRLSETPLVVSPLSAAVGRDVYELDTNRLPRLGAFSKPRSKASDSPLAALKLAAEITATQPGVGDLLVRRDYLGRWQVWERRTAKGRVGTSGGGSRAKMKPCGTGRIFIE